jgi:hypothetical protein
MKTQELIEALAAYPPTSEVSLCHWNGQGTELSPVLFVCDNSNSPSIYAAEWDGHTPADSDAALRQRFARLGTGEGMTAWYQHPGEYYRLVVLTGAKWTPGNPHVEWSDWCSIPKEYRQDLKPGEHPELIKANDLPGKWAACDPPAV